MAWTAILPIHADGIYSRPCVDIFSGPDAPEECYDIGEFADFTDADGEIDEDCLAIAYAAKLLDLGYALGKAERTSELGQDWWTVALGSVAD